MIDLDYFPHITDLIFDNAPFASLFVMSLVCRAWRDRVASQFYHLHDAFARPVSYSEFQFHFRFHKTGPEEILRTDAEKQLLRYCRIVDSVCTSRLHARGLLRRATVRCVPKEISASFNLDTAQRIVAANFWGYVHANAYIEKAVIVQRYDRDPHHFDDRDGPPAAEMVYIFDHQDRGGLLDEWDCDEVWWAFRNILHAVKRRPMVSLTLVGIERLSNPQHTYLSADLEAEIQEIIDGQVSPDRLKAMTIEEYREHIGEEEFKIETDWGEGTPVV